MAWSEVEGATYAASGSTIRCEQGAVLTPSAGAITVTDSFHSVAAGTLSTIHGGVANSLYVLLATGTITISAVTNIVTQTASIAAGGLLVLWFDGTNFTDAITLATRQPSSYQVGSSTATYKPSGLLTYSNSGGATPASTVETTLWTYTLPANALANNGDRLRIRITGIFAANANTKTIRFYVNASAYVLNNLTTAPNAVGFLAEIVLLRTGAAAVTIFGNTIVGATYQTYNASNTTPSLSSATTLSCTGQNGSASAGDITAGQIVVEYLPS